MTDDAAKLLSADPDELRLASRTLRFGATGTAGSGTMTIS